MKPFKKCILAALALTMMTMLAGCGKPITLETALKNSEAITSYSYFVDLNFKESGTTEDENMAFQMNMDGKVNATADRIQAQADVSATVDGESVKLPIYIDTATNEFDFEVYAGIPDILKETFAGKTDFFASSEQLLTLMQFAMTEEQYKEYEKKILDYFKSDPQSQPLAAAIEAYVQSYLEKNSETIQKFESIEGKKVSENGTYSFTFTKTDLKTMITEFLSNADNYKLIQDAYDGALLSQLGQGTPIDMPDAETLIKTITDAIDELKSVDLTVKFIIEDTYMTGLSINLTGVDMSDVQAELALTMRISDINEAVKITMPDKYADTTLDIMQYIKDMSSMTTDTGEAEISPN